MSKKIIFLLVAIIALISTVYGQVSIDYNIPKGKLGILPLGITVVCFDFDFVVTVEGKLLKSMKFNKNKVKKEWIKVFVFYNYPEEYGVIDSQDILRINHRGEVLDQVHAVTIKSENNTYLSYGWITLKEGNIYFLADNSKVYIYDTRSKKKLSLEEFQRKFEIEITNEDLTLIEKIKSLPYIEVGYINRREKALRDLLIKKLGKKWNSFIKNPL